MYLLKRIDIWARNRLKRVVKTPKLQFFALTNPGFKLLPPNSSQLAKR